MLAARYTQGGGLAIEKVAVPAIGDDELLVRVEAASICGTDVKIIRHGHRKLTDGQTITLGHEFVGRIEEAGPRVHGFEVGMRVGVAPNIGCGSCEMCARGLMNMCPDYEAFGITFDGAHAEFVRIPHAAIAQGSVVPLPGNVSALEATLAEPLSCALNGVRASRIDVGDAVLVYGAGPMGLLNMMLAGISGASRIIAVDLNDSRLEAARQIGATDVVNSTKQSVRDWVAEQTSGRGVDVVILAVPVPQLQQEAVEILAPFGRLCLFAGWANGTAGVTLNTNPIHYRNLVVTGMTGGSPRDYRDALKLIARNTVDVTPIISDAFHLSELDRAYERAQSGEGMKIVIGADRSICFSSDDQEAHVVRHSAITRARLGAMQGTGQ